MRYSFSLWLSLIALIFVAFFLFRAKTTSDSSRVQFRQEKISHQQISDNKRPKKTSSVRPTPNVVPEAKIVPLEFPEQGGKSSISTASEGETVPRAIRVFLRSSDRPAAFNDDPLMPELPKDVEFVIQEGHQHDVMSIAIDSEGKYIVAADYLGKIKLWDLDTGQLIRIYRDGLSEEHGKQVNIDPQGRFIVSSGSRVKAKVWSLTENLLLNSFSQRQKVAMDQNGHFIALYDRNGATVRDATDFGFVRTINTKDITAVAFEPDGNYLITGHQKGDLVRWELDTGEADAKFSLGSDKVWKLLIDNEGKYLISTSGERKIHIWNLESLTLLHTIQAVPKVSPPRKSYLNTVALDPLGRYIASGGNDGHINIWKLSNGALVRRIKKPERGMPQNSMHRGVISLAIDPSGQYIVSGSEWGALRIWSLDTGQLVRKLSGNSYEMVVPGSPPAYGAARPRSPKVRGLADKPTIHRTDSELKFAVVKTDDNGFSVWDIHSCRLLRHFADRDNLSACEMDPKGRFLITGDRNDIISVYDLKTGALLRQLANSQGQRQIKWLMVDGKGRRIISLHIEKSQFPKPRANILNIWALEDGRLIKSISGYQKFQFSPEGSYIAGLGSDNTLNIWSLDTGKKQRTFDLPAKPESISVVDFIHKGEIVVVGCKRQLYFWNVQTGLEYKTPEVGKDIYKRIETDPSGRYVVYAARQRRYGYGQINRHFHTVNVSPRTPEGKTPKPHHYYIEKIRGRRHLNLPPDFDTTATVWDIKKGKIVLRVSGHKHKILRFEVDPFGKYAVSASDYGIKIWRLATGELIKTIRQKRALTQIAVDPDGKYVVAGGYGSLAAWQLSTGELVNQTKGISKLKRLRIINDTKISTQPVILAETTDDRLTMTELLSGERLEISELALRQHISVKEIRGDLILSESAHNGLTLWNRRTGEKLTMVSGGKEWLVYDSRGYFSGSRYGGGLVAMVQGLNSYGIDQFATRSNRPDILLRKMRLGSDDLISHFHNRYLKRLRKLGLTEEQLSPDLHVPTAEILEMQQRGKFVRVKFKLSDDRYMLKRYNIYVNDIPLFGGAGKEIRGDRFVKEEEIELCSGKNKIEISCTNEKGTESFRALTYATYDVKVYGDLYYLGFGVSKYKNRDLNLNYADKDAKDLEELFTQIERGYNHIRYRTFVNEEVTVEAVKRVKELLTNASVDDTLVLFIAGHGLHDTDREATYYYLTHEADLDNLSGTAVDFDAIEELLNDVAPRKKILLMDTCESGEIDDYIRDHYFAAAESRGFQPRTTRAIRVVSKYGNRDQSRSYLLNQDRYIYNDLTRRTGAIVFSSSKGGEFSYENESIENGFFTEGLIQSFQTDLADIDGDGLLSTDEMREYVTSTVADMSGGLQHPTVDRDNIYQRIEFPLLQRKGSDQAS